MFTSRSGLFRLVMNTILTLVLFIIFRHWGWITVSDALPLWATALIVVLASLVVGWLVNLLGIVLLPLIAVVACLTAGLGMILLPAVFQYFTLLLIAKWTLLFSMTTVWWQAIIIGLAFAIFKFTKPSSSSSSSSSD